MKIAITGGIGSGKSFICQHLAQRGIKVYNCDEAAKQLLRTSPQMQLQLSKLVGPELYRNNQLQKKILASFILENSRYARAVDDIIHPAVARDFETSGFDWLESAILFDSNFISRTPIHFVVCVTAPTPLRIERIVKRNNITPEQAKKWVDRQMSQAEIISRSNYEIINDGQHDINRQLDQLLQTLEENELLNKK